MDTTLEVSNEAGQPGDTGIPITVTTSKAITVGSTDLILTFDPAALQAMAATTTTLSSFAHVIDNAAGEVRTASSLSRKLGNK